MDKIPLKDDTKCTFLHTLYTHTKHAIKHMVSLGNTYNPGGMHLLCSLN